MLSAKTDGPLAERALEELCARYWPPLRAFAERMGCSRADAEDMAQGFFLSILRNDTLARADPSRGTLRSFLLTAFRRHVQDQWSRQNAQKRGGGSPGLSLDESRDAEPGTEADGDFDREWAARVMELGLERLESRYRREDKETLFQTLRPYLVVELPDGAVPGLAAKLSMSGGAAKVALHRLRKRFGEALRAEVADTLGPGGDLEGELRHLMRSAV